MNFAFPLAAQYNGSRYGALLALNVVELFSHSLLDCPFSALNFLLIFRTSILHPNLKVILLCQSACIFVRGIGRIVLLVARLCMDNNLMSGGPTLLRVIYIQPTFIRNFIIHVLVIERILATLLATNYEKWRRVRCLVFGASWIFIVSSISLFNALASTIISPNFASYFILSVYSSLIFFGILEMLAFVWIWKYNDQIYQNILITKSLSERYQIAENIRTSKQLIPCIILHFFNIFYGAAMNFAGFFRLFGPDQFFYDLFCNQLIFTLVTIVSFFIELSMIFFHPSLKRDFLRCFHSVLSNFSPKSTAVFPMTMEMQKTISIVGIRGQQLMPQKEAVGEHHFRELKSTWQTRRKQI